MSEKEVFLFYSSLHFSVKKMMTNFEINPITKRKLDIKMTIKDSDMVNIIKHHMEKHHSKMRLEVIEETSLNNGQTVLFLNFRESHKYLKVSFSDLNEHPDAGFEISLVAKNDDNPILFGESVLAGFYYIPSLINGNFFPFKVLFESGVTTTDFTLTYSNGKEILLFSDIEIQFT